MPDNQKKMHGRIIMEKKDMMTNYAKLLRKYEKSYVHGEKRSPGYESKIRVQSALKNRIMNVV